MKAEQLYSRTLRVYGLDPEKDYLSEFTITVSYVDDDQPRIDKGIVLDHRVMPRILAALNDED